MTYNEFKLRFAIQYVGCVSDPGECMRRMDNAPALARLLWDVMNAPEVKAPAAPITTEFPKNMANSPKDMANSPDLKPSNSTELKALAELAAERGFAWIAQDKCRIWYGYKVEPEFREHLQEWWGRGNGHWAALNLPDNTDYSKQIFNVKTILENE